jgi:translation initiation factor 1
MRRPEPDTLVYSSERSVPGARRFEAPEVPPRRAADGNTARTRDPRAGASKDEPAGTAARSSDPDDGVVRVWLERKGRNGEPVSIVRGLRVDGGRLAEIATRLKKLCGTGGSAKGGEIVIQGDHRARIAAELERDGLKVKLAGG